MAEKKNILDKIKLLISSQKDEIRYYLRLIIIVVFYGILINYVGHSLFSLTFNIKNIITFGILSYVVKVEIPHIISSCFPERKER